MSAVSALHWLSANDAADRIRRRDLSPVELTRALIDRIVTHDHAYNAFITFTPETALAEAKRAESSVMTGTNVGSLHGVPYALKDIIDAVGLPTTCHSAILTRNLATADAEVTRRVKAAGGILLGKLSTHEFALGGPAFDLPFPPARNPWNRNIGPGGSSSGAGVAVAAGFVPLALGTDTGGSIRNPASQCGIVGLKGTYGRVSRRGVFPLAYGLDHVGPMTRTVADNALLMNVLAGHDPADKASSDRVVPDFRAELGRGIEGLRIGVFRHFHARDMIASPVVADAIGRALDVMRRQGAEVVDITTAPLADYAACNRIILLSEACAVHGAWLKERPQDYSRMTRERLLPGLFVNAADYIQAMRWRGQLIDQMNRALSMVNVAIAASSMDPPHAIDDPVAIEKYYPRQARTPFNLTGHPALAMPAGFTDDGLPLSFQIVGSHFDESTVYRVAASYEQATRWHERHPLMEQTH